MNAPAVHALPLITCERGLGRLVASACARRHQLANAEPRTLGTHEKLTASAIRNSPCRACPHGAERVAAGLVQAPKPLLRVAAPKPPPPEPEPETEQPEEQDMELDRNNIVCAQCGARFKAKPTGKVALYCCPECKTQAVAARAGRAPSKRSPRVLAEPRPPVLAVSRSTPELAAALRNEPANVPVGWPYAINLRGLPVCCRTVEDLVAVVERFGASA